MCRKGGWRRTLRKPSLNVIIGLFYIIDCLSYRSYHSIRDSFDSFDSLICDWLWWHVIAHVKKILDWIDSFYSNLPYSIDSSIFLNSDRDRRISVVVLVVFAALTHICHLNLIHQSLRLIVIVIVIIIIIKYHIRNHTTAKSLFWHTHTQEKDRDRYKNRNRKRSSLR